MLEADLTRMPLGTHDCLYHQHANHIVDQQLYPHLFDYHRRVRRLSFSVPKVVPVFPSRQAGERVNHTRTERCIYRRVCRSDAAIPISERQLLVRPIVANHVWSMDFVFDCSADSRVVQCLTIVDDGTHE